MVSIISVERRIPHIPVKVLVTVLTYPCPSLKYVETVCTAGVTEDGRWVRMYPLRLRMLDNDIHKWHWHEFDLEQRPADKDVRIESYYCLHIPPSKQWVQWY